MTQSYTIVQVDKSEIDLIHTRGWIRTQEDISYYPNQYILLKDPMSNGSAIGKISEDKQSILRVADTIKKRRFKVQPKNLEQTLALDALLSDVPAITLTGVAGSGKTILCCGAALHLLDNDIIERVVITRPMSTIGKYQLGFLPGPVHEKFEPYLINYRCNFEQLIGHYEALDGLIMSGKVQILPLQLMRGASFARTMVLVDEAQVLTVEDMISIGTRVGEESRIVFIGDLDQRDEPILKEETGLYKLAHSEKARQSPLITQIELTTCVRSSLAAQFSSFF